MKLGLVVFRVLNFRETVCQHFVVSFALQQEKWWSIGSALGAFYACTWQFVKVYAIFPWLILFESLCTKIVVHGFVDQRMMAWFLCLVVSSCHQVFCIMERVVSF